MSTLIIYFITVQYLLCVPHKNSVVHARTLTTQTLVMQATQMLLELMLGPCNIVLAGQSTGCAKK